MDGHSSISHNPKHIEAQDLGLLKSQAAPQGKSIQRGKLPLN